MNKLLLLMMIHTGRGTTVVVVFAKANFNKNQLCVILQQPRRRPVVATPWALVGARRHRPLAVLRCVSTHLSAFTTCGNRQQHARMAVHPYRSHRGSASHRKHGRLVQSLALLTHHISKPLQNPFKTFRYPSQTFEYPSNRF